MAKYKVYFDCVVTLDRDNAHEAIKDSWLIENIDKNGVFTYQKVEKVVE
jgi:hypothetical protein